MALRSNKGPGTQQVPMCSWWLHQASRCQRRSSPAPRTRPSTCCLRGTSDMRSSQRMRTRPRRMPRDWWLASCNRTQRGISLLRKSRRSKSPSRKSRSWKNLKCWPTCQLRTKSSWSRLRSMQSLAYTAEANLPCLCMSALLDKPRSMPSSRASNYTGTGRRSTSDIIIAGE